MAVWMSAKLSLVVKKSLNKFSLMKQTHDILNGGLVCQN
jgi:hypothetical protein